MQLPKFQAQKPSVSGAKKPIVQISQPTLIQAPNMKTVLPHNVEAIRARGRQNAAKYEALGKIGKQASRVFGKIYVDSEEAKADRLLAEYRKMMSQHVTNESRTAQTQTTVTDPVTGEQRVVRQWETMKDRTTEMRERFMQYAEENGYLDSNIARQKFGNARMALDIRYDEEIDRFVEGKRIDLGKAETLSALQNASTPTEAQQIGETLYSRGYASAEEAARLTREAIAGIEQHKWNMEYVNMMEVSADSSRYQQGIGLAQSRIAALEDLMEKGTYVASDGTIQQTSLNYKQISNMIVKTMEHQADLQYKVSQESWDKTAYNLQRALTYEGSFGSVQNIPTDPKEFGDYLDKTHPDMPFEHKQRLMDHNMMVREGRRGANINAADFFTTLRQCSLNRSGEGCDEATLRKASYEVKNVSPEMAEKIDEEWNKYNLSLNTPAAHHRQSVITRLKNPDLYPGFDGTAYAKSNEEEFEIHLENALRTRPLDSFDATKLAIENMIVAKFGLSIDSPSGQEKFQKVLNDMSDYEALVGVNSTEPKGLNDEQQKRWDELKELYGANADYNSLRVLADAWTEAKQRGETNAN